MPLQRRADDARRQGDCSTHIGGCQDAARAGRISSARSVSSARILRPSSSPPRSSPRPRSGRRRRAGACADRGRVPAQAEARLVGGQVAGVGVRPHAAVHVPPLDRWEVGGHRAGARRSHRQGGAPVLAGSSHLSLQRPGGASRRGTLEPKRGSRGLSQAHASRETVAPSASGARPAR